MYICIVCVYECMCVYMYVCKYVWMDGYLCDMCIHACYVCYVCICMHMYMSVMCVMSVCPMADPVMGSKGAIAPHFHV
jgi:hypothetical protein